jgi:type I restriction enzyme, S subunit
LHAAWARVSANINVLLKREQGVTTFQEALRKLAVRGLLSEWTEEHPLIDKIKTDCAALKQEYFRKGWLRKQKIVISRTSEKDKYPPHWAVVPFDDIGIVIGGITKGRDLKGRDVKSCPYLSVANVQRGFFDLAEIKNIEVPISEIAKYRVEKGDLLITEGGDWDKVGRTAIWAGELPECLHQNHVFKARVPSAILMNEWVEMVFNSDVGRDYFAEASKQTTNLASINMAQLRSFPMPIPPLSEQLSILQKVQNLLYLCREIERQVVESQSIARLLATAAVESITGIRIEEKEKMKAPKTELVSNLRIGASPTNGDQAPLTAILARNQGVLSAKTLWNSSALEIDAFYQQLKIEMAKGWIVQPEVAYVKEVETS